MADDPGAVAAADQDLARINRLLDAMINAWIVSRPRLAAAFPDPMVQLASLSFTLFFVGDPQTARAFAERHDLDTSTLPDEQETVLSPADMPCLLAVAIDRLSKRADVPDRKFVDDLGRRWEWCGGQPRTWAWRITELGAKP